MKNSELNKQLGIGPGGINCPCCVSYPKKRHNHKKLYRRLKRKIMKVLTKKEIYESDI